MWLGLVLNIFYNALQCSLDVLKLKFQIKMKKLIDSAKKTNRVKQVIVTHKTFCVSTSDGKMAALSATLPAVKGLLWYWLGHGPRQRHEFAHCHLEDKTGLKWPGDGAWAASPQTCKYCCLLQQIWKFTLAEIHFPTNMERLKT